jgi:hypothetical protein
MGDRQNGRMELTYALLLAAFSGVLGFVGGLLGPRLLERDRAQREECQQLRDLAAELQSHVGTAATAGVFNFLELSRSGWDDAPKDLLRREAATTYELCRVAYARVAELNMHSANVLDRGRTRAADEGIAQRDVRALLSAAHPQLESARAAVADFTSRHCR